jgi:hypothetical protein
MYCITLRSGTDARITDWYDGSDSRWSTDHKRRKLFDKKRDARAVCQELRKLCPRISKVISVEAAKCSARGAGAAIALRVSAELQKIIERADRISARDDRA